MKRLIVDRKLKLISINYKVIIDFEKLQLILKSYNLFGRKLHVWLISILGLLIKWTYDWLTLQLIYGLTIDFGEL